ncbi:MAG: hypothetical protein AVDCRST_MAG53-1518, partial [uncultured Solirubrobacteraceae bacterium]
VAVPSTIGRPRARLRRAHADRRSGGGDRAAERLRQADRRGQALQRQGRPVALLDCSQLRPALPRHGPAAPGIPVQELSLYDQAQVPLRQARAGLLRDPPV